MPRRLRQALLPLLLAASAAGKQSYRPKAD